MTILNIVVPCYNEEEVLPETSRQLLSLLVDLLSKGKVSEGSGIYFVDDGSTDQTWALIEELSSHDSRIHGFKLTRNRGHQNALLAGLLTVDGDIVVSVDADLQDDIDVIEDMINTHRDGYDVVYGVREERGTDTWFKRTTAELYYKMLKLMGIDLVFNHADFRLMSRRALDALKEYNEVNLFLRGIIPTIGYPYTVVNYKRNERFAGESKYPLRKMLVLAIDGITSFSPLPLRMISFLGVVIFLFSLIISSWALWVKFVSGNAIPGWTSSVLPMYFLGGVQLFSIGVVGEYVAKIYMETKRRPRFIIEKII